MCVCVCIHIYIYIYYIYYIYIIFPQVLKFSDDAIIDERTILEIIKILNIMILLMMVRLWICYYFCAAEI